MVCNKCGSPITPGATFCTNCGAPVEAQAPQTYNATPVYNAPQPAAVPGKGLAITSMVLGIISLALFCFWYLAIPCAIVGLILGAVAINKSRITGIKNNMAIAGVACSCVALGAALIFILIVAISCNSLMYY